MTLNSTDWVAVLWLVKRSVDGRNLVARLSFWNIIIQWTSHDDLTEKPVSLVSLAKQLKNLLNKFKTEL